MRRSTAVIASFVASWLTACDPGGSLLVVDLLTDFGPGVEFDGVITELHRGPRAEGAPAQAVEARAPGARTRVAELEDVPNGLHLVRVSLRLGDAEVAESRVLVDVRGDSQAVTMVVTASCRGVTCAEGQSCRGGSCQDERCSPETPERCAPPECERDSDCPPDGPACNAGVCLAGVCGVRPDDGACASGRCDRLEGCVLEPIDAGPPPFDAGPPPMDGGTCDESPCRLVAPQCGCAAGEMCSVAAAPGCVPAGTADVDAPCSSDFECRPGLGCPNNLGLCRPYCDASAQCGDASCIQLQSGAPVGNCTYVCDPIGRTGCPTGRSCYLGQATRIGDSSPSIDLFCLAPGPGGIGDVCDLPSDCQDGLMCANDRCRAVCDRDAPDCATGTCRMLALPATLHGVTYGDCL